MGLWLSWVGRVALVVAVVVGLVLVVRWHQGAGGRELDEARERWRENRPASYSFTYEACSGMCVGCELRITVRNGQVAATRGRDGDCGTVTIEGLFDHAAYLLDGAGYESVTVRYDATYGYPSWGEGSCDEGVTDCGEHFAVTGFQEAPSAPAGPGPSSR